MEEQIKNGQLRCTRLFMHNSCYIKLCIQGSQRKWKTVNKSSHRTLSKDESSFNSSTTVTKENFSSSSLNRTHTASVVHDKTKCICSFHVQDKQQPNRNSSKLFLIIPNYSKLFKRHTILLKDDETRISVTTLVDFIDSGTDPFAIEV